MSLKSQILKCSSRKNQLAILAFALINFAILPTKAQSLRGRINFENDTVHLELNGTKDWNYDLKKQKKQNQTVAELLIDSLDEKTEKDLATFKSPLVTKVEVQRGQIDNKVKVLFYLKQSDIETFDYLTDQPSRLIVDFYQSEEANAATPVSKAKESVKPMPKKLSIAQDAKSTRNPASSDLLKIDSTGSLSFSEDVRAKKAGVYDGADPLYERFTIKDFQINEDSIIKSKERYRINFPNIDEIPTDFVQIINAPNLYKIAPQDNDENKQARLLLTLFEKERFNVYFKTLEWFKEKYPESKYNELIDFITADVSLKLWKKDQSQSKYFASALQQLQAAVQKYPNSTLAEKASFLQGALSYQKGEFFNSLRYFLAHTENKNIQVQNSYSKDLAKLGMALSYEKIKKFSESLAQWDDLEKSTPYKSIREEALYRKGDTYLNSAQFEKAIEAYQRALKKEPAAAGRFPSSLYNQAQSLFSLKDFKNGLQVYLDFIKTFPQNENIPFALTRVGELLEIMGAPEDKVLGAYMETAFRFGNDQKAVVAQIRLLSGRMSNMKDKEVEQATKEIMALSQKSDIPKIQEFATVMISEGYQKRKDYGKAIDLLEKYYQANPSSVDTNLFKKRIVSNISDQIKKYVSGGKDLQALEYYKKNSDGWLKYSDRLDTGYFLGQAYEKLGAFEEALKYYGNLDQKLKEQEGSTQLKERYVQEGLPSTQSLSLRLSQVNFQTGDYKKSAEDLKRIKNPDRLSEDEQIERVILISQNEEKRGDDFTAKRFLKDLVQDWTGQPAKVSEPIYRIGLIDLKMKKPEDALTQFKKIQELAKETKKVPAETEFQTLSRMVEIYNQQQRKEDLISAYTEILEKFEETRPLGSFRYKLGQIYFEKGEVQKANEVWSAFKGQKSEFWKNLAQDQMKNADWKDSYKKYIQRIPAMSQKE